ncbi:aminotransferase class V-fold PLP-dependent enzyme [Effusibacillus lacus]|uniref:cysteine desulfurase n=1 Tax=Effusibacillus lacus TaxID=1348429 RepID=A0A292YJP7_9BACL|nr:aminotransferase class V-fold PLP-dependent enzyme [Effusibacillus lacus]TCS75186.1 cysteine desulfurase family protein [Effusibacillus lacus]GAX89131.1 cysteine desulfurase [Effusibacillus lacus]
MIYLDNAASTWPKPPQVAEAMAAAVRDYSANPGRSGHRLAAKAAETISNTRAQVARLFHVKNPNDVIFTQNATESLNLGLKGFLQPGDHVITTSLEHNSVRRPLEYLRKKGVDITYVPSIGDDQALCQEVEKEFRATTRLLVVTHSSNLTGRILPVERLGELARKHRVKFMVDASQTAGYLPIDVEAMRIDMLAFTGHKGLYGPQGTGGLYIHPDLELDPLLHGGTGGFSELIEQPPGRPERYESGTRNTAGIAGLSAGLQFIEDTGLASIRRHEEHLTQLLLEELARIDGLTQFGPDRKEARCPIVSFSVAGYDANEIGYILDTHYEIAVRAGLHCSPLAHETLGTAEGGLVRASLGYFNNETEIEEFVGALKDIMA